MINFILILIRILKKYTATKINIQSTNQIFEKIEKGIISLTSMEVLIKHLNNIDSREDYHLFLK